jgi:hypothetical protein
MACGNNHVSRDCLHSAPVTESPLQQIRVRLPEDDGKDRLKADVWTTHSGSFQDREGVTREHRDVDSPGRDKSDRPTAERWDFRPDPGATKKSYTHMTGRAGWLGPKAVIDRLPKEAAEALRGRRSIVLGKSADQTWVNERATTFDSRDRSQTTVVRRAE